VTGQAGFIKTAQQLSFFLIIPGVILFHFGHVVLRRLSAPILILIFMTPYAEPFYWYLQVFVASISAEILSLFGIPVFLENTNIHLPSLTVHVAAACTGIRFMTAMVPIAITIAHIHLHLRWKKVALVTTGVVLALLANVSRIVIMLMSASKGFDTFVAGTSHLIYGYGIFLLALIALFWFARLLVRSTSEAFFKQQRISTRGSPSEKPFFMGFSSYRNLVVLALLVLVPGLVHARLMTQSVVLLRLSLDSFPLVLGEWRGHELGEDEWHPRIVGAKQHLRRMYKDACGNEIRIFVSYLPIQTQGQELIHQANRTIPPGFQPAPRNSRVWTINANPFSLRLTTNVYLPTNGETNTKLLCWYQNTGRYLHDKYISKIFLALDSLFKNRSNGAVYVVISKGSFRQNEVPIHNFLNSFIPEISKYVPS
jgi:EpsI family protein